MKAKEKIIVNCRPHWVTLVVPAVLCVLYLLCTVSLYFQGRTEDSKTCLVVTVVFLVVTLIRNKSRSLVMTESSIIGKIGVIRTRKLVSPISKVQDISISNGLFGKIFGYSTICISTAGSAGIEYVFKRVTNGVTLQEEFLSRSK